jgi:hypothetical protein
MDAIVVLLAILAAVLLFDALAVFFGHDSRPFEPDSRAYPDHHRAGPRNSGISGTRDS